MNNVNELCFSCMSKKNSTGICPSCGFDNNSYTPPVHHLKPGTLLAGKYVTGKALGEGGFGITYIGYDLNLEIKVAIKEYFPNGFVSRDVSNTDTVTVFSGSGQEAYETGKNKFINEAKSLAKFDNMPGIVSVKDFFLENGTAYIVMEYIEGETLKSFLARNGGKTSPENIFEMMKPLIKSLAEVHKQGIIHRDISPDNIMITKDSKIKLLDFGAARDISTDGQKSLSIQLKPGYAPEEQYRSHGNQGAWTDVYALCATIYRSITGVQPMEALERMQNDTVIPPSQMGVAISMAQENAIMRGMAVFANQRLQNMDVLYNEMYGNTPYNVPPQQQFNQQPMNGVYGGMQNNNNNKKTAIIIAAVFAVFVIAAVIVVLCIMSGSDKKETVTSTPPPIIATTAPTVIPKPVMTTASSSSIRGTDSEGGQYSTDAVLYEDPMTKWVPAKNTGNGVGEWIQVSAASPQHVSGVKILNGYHKNAQTWANNNRVQLCTISFSNGESRDFVLDDTMNMITLDFGGAVDTTFVKLTIRSVYSGAKWNDTAITYLGVY